MLIIRAVNKTGTKPDGTSEYRVEALLNERQFFSGVISGHVRQNGAGELLRKIADAMEKSDYEFRHKVKLV